MLKAATNVVKKQIHDLIDSQVTKQLKPFLEARPRRLPIATPDSAR